MYVVGVVCCWCVVLVVVGVCCGVMMLHVHDSYDISILCNCVLGVSMCSMCVHVMTVC